MTNAATGPGFTVTASPANIISCKIYNEQLAPSRVTTQLSAADGEIPAGGSASDSATLHSVSGTASGSLQYRFYGSLAACDSDVAAFPGTPPSGGTLVSTVPVTGGVAPPSAAHTFGAAGTFHWAAFYSGDPSNLPAASKPAPPSRWWSRRRNRGSPRCCRRRRGYSVGGSASDAATLHSVSGTAGGSLQYRFYGRWPPATAMWRPSLAPRRRAAPWCRRCR